MKEAMQIDKRKLITDTALKLFVDNGFHDTPTSRIAKESGIAVGTLFYFFPTKDELVRAMYIEIKGQMTVYIQEQISEETKLYEILKGYYTASLQWALAHTLEFKFIEQFNHSPYLRQIATAEIQSHIKPVMDLLKRGVKEQILKPLDPDVIFTLISGHTFGINHYLLDKKYSKPKQDKVIRETFELLWNMISRIQ